MSLEDLLQLVHLYAERGSPKYERAALRVAFGFAERSGLDGRTHDNRRYVKSSRIESASLSLPGAVGLFGTLVYLRGWATVAVGVRLFIIAIAVLAVAALAFLIASG